VPDPPASNSLNLFVPFELGPAGVPFGQAVVVRMPMPAGLDSTQQEAAGLLTIRRYDAGADAWTTAGIVPESVQFVDGPNGRMIEFQVTGFSYFALAASKSSDINADGVTNAVDVQLVINAALGIDIGILKTAADINGDGLVNAVDVQRVINGALGLPPVE